MLKISLLTPFAIELDGQPIKLASRRTEALFIYLLRNPQTHSRDVLASLFWDDLPQKKAMGNLRVLLANLKKELEPFVTIERKTAGINLNSQCQTDVAQLESALTLSRQEIDDDGALSELLIEELGRQLEQFEGELLPGFYLKDGLGFEEWLTTDREWLWSRVVDALDDLATENLANGNYRAGIEQAQKLVTLHPLREEGHQLLMQLWAADNQVSSALAQYQKCIALLKTELNIDPHPFTTDLYQQMKDGVWELTQPSSSILSLNAGPIKHNLPRLLAPTIGREPTLIELEALLRNHASPMISIVGLGGIGKTALALSAAWRMTGEDSPYKDGVFFIPLQDVFSPVEVPLAIANTLKFKFSKKGGDESAQILQHLQPLSCLLVFDNVEHLIGQTEFFNQIIGAGLNVKLLLTSRERLNLPAETILQLSGLPYPNLNSALDEGEQAFASVELFVTTVRQNQGHADFDQNSRRAIGNICRLVEGMPLAILLAAATVDSLTPTEIEMELEKGLSILASEDQDDKDQHRSMRAVFFQSWNLLSKDEQRIFARMGIFAGGCDRQVALAVTDGRLRDLQTLVQKSLLERDLSSGRFSIHPLLRQFALEQLSDLNEQEARLHLVALETLESVYANSLSSHYPDLAQHASSAHQIEKAVTYFEGAGDVAKENYQNRLAIEYFSKAINGLKSDHKNKHVQIILKRIRANRWLGIREEQRKDLEMLDQFDLEEVSGVQQVEIQLEDAYLAESRGEFKKAAEMAKKAVELARTYNCTSLEGYALWLWGGALTRQTQNKLAEEKLRDALTIIQKTDKIRDVGGVLNLLGLVVCELGKYDEGISFFKQTLEISQKTKDKLLEGRVLNSLGLAALEQGRIEDAEHYFYRSYAIRQQTGDRYGQGITLSNLATVLLGLGKFEEAYQVNLQTIDICTEIDDQWGVEVGLGNLAAVEQAWGDRESAVKHYDEALEICRKISNRADECRTLSYKGMTLWGLGHHAQGKLACEDALKIARESKSLDEETIILNHLGTIEAAAGNFQTAIDYFDQAIELRQKMNQHRLTLDPKSGRAFALLKMGSDEQALADAGAIFEAISEKGLNGLENPSKVVCECVSIFHRADDRRAEDFLERGHLFLQHRANQFSDPEKRAGYLEKHPEHQKIIKWFESGIHIQKG